MSNCVGLKLGSRTKFSINRGKWLLLWATSNADQIKDYDKLLELTEICIAESENGQWFIQGGESESSILKLKFEKEELMISLRWVWRLLTS